MRQLPVVPGATALGHGKMIQEQRLVLLRAAGRAGPLSRIRLLHRWILLANSPEAAHEVLVEKARSFEKAPGARVILSDIAGTGLFTSEGELWRKQRRLMASLFQPSQLPSYVPTMKVVANRAAARMADGQSIDIAAEMTRITMNVVAATLFGADTHEASDEIAEALTIAFAWVDRHIASVALTLQLTAFDAFESLAPHWPRREKRLRRRLEALLNGPSLLPGRNDPQLVAAIRTLDSRMQQLIGERRANPQARIDLLTKLLLVRDLDVTVDEGMSDRQARDEAATLFVAGHETTANALAWSVYLLARHPEARARVQAEADGFDSDASTPYVPEQLEYTTRVFKEALRLYPPILVLPRRSLEPVELGGVRHPAQTLVFVNPYGLHYDDKLWPDPERFDPERFTRAQESGRHRSAWLPFGVGPRVCIGAGFALIEGPIVLATLMRRARFEIDPARVIEPEAFATLRPRGGVPARVRLQPAR